MGCVDVNLFCFLIVFESECILTFQIHTVDFYKRDWILWITVIKHNGQSQDSKDNNAVLLGKAND